MPAGDGGVEQLLAERIALVKVVLACANLIVISIDRVDPKSNDNISISYIVCGFFLLYMIASLVVVRKRLIPLQTYQLAVPAFDVLAITSVMLANSGYLSPLNVWFSIAVVSTGFSRSLAAPFIAATLAMVAQIAIALVPQDRALEPQVFFVRGFFLLGFTTLVALISNQLVRQARALRAIDEFGREVASKIEAPEAVLCFTNFARDYLGAESVSVQNPGLPVETANHVAFGVDQDEGTCVVERKRPLTSDEQQIVRVLGNRLGAALQRITLGQELVAAVAREERQRYADELHDTHLQTLAAIDMHVELASRRSSEQRVIDELKEIKLTIRDAAKRTRAFISSVDQLKPSGPIVIEQIVRDRWPEATTAMDRHAELTEGQWRAVQMLAQEGINNARRHGGAQKGHLELTSDDVDIVASLTCDGRSPKVNFRYGYGLRRLQTVVEANHGIIELVPAINGGSILRATFTININRD
ncbi:hypothetical protein BH11ARM1_BH11ARM1_06380 [soil metagenome]